MSIRDRVTACLRAHRGTPLCARCMAKELAVTSIVGVYEAIGFLSWQPRAQKLGFVGGPGRCTRCGNPRLVIAAVGS